MTGKQFSLDEVEALAGRVLAAAGASSAAASSVARSIRLAERDGIRSHGLLYLPIYAEHLHCGKVLGLAERGVDFKDLQTRESSLEDIFVSLVRSRA